MDRSHDHLTQAVPTDVDSISGDTEIVDWDSDDDDETDDEVGHFAATDQRIETDMASS
jgi:hypothetical protein